MNNLALIVANETYKLLKWKTLVVFICCSALATFLIGYTFDTELKMEYAIFGSSQIPNLWYAFLSGCRLVNVIVWPLFCFFLPVLMMYVEHKNSAFLLWSVLPETQYKFFLQKFWAMIAYLFVLVLFCSIAMGISAYINGAANKPELNAYSFAATLDQQAYFAVVFFINQMGILTLLLLINFRLKHFPFALMCSFLFWLSGFIIPSKMNYLPTAYALKSAVNFTANQGNTHPYALKLFTYEMYSVLWVIGLHLLAFLLGTNRLLFPKK